MTVFFFLRPFTAVDVDVYRRRSFKSAENISDETVVLQIQNRGGSAPPSAPPGACLHACVEAVNIHFLHFELIPFIEQQAGMLQTEARAKQPCLIKLSISKRGISI